MGKNEPGNWLRLISNWRPAYFLKNFILTMSLNWQGRDAIIPSLGEVNEFQQRKSIDNALQSL
jgi:hypothetical protein